MIWDIDSALSVIDVSGWTTPSGHLIVRGHVLLSDEDSGRRLIAENRGSNASCSQASDGGLELVSLTVSFRYQGSRERVLATVTPNNGPVTRSGAYDATFRFHDDALGSHPVKLTIDFEAHMGGGAEQQGGGRQSLR